MDTPEKQPVRVSIFNQSFTLLVEGDPAEIEDAANEVDELMHTIARSGNLDSMRVAMLAFAGLIGLSAVPTGISASPSGAIRSEAGSAPYFVEVAQGCGPGFHWVGKHRNRYGAWVPGRCARN